jgi:hypothetical protein
MAPDVEKRLRYFNGQFLQEEDFADEQAYHIDRQRRHNRLLHTPGIAEGLDVKADKGAREAKVMPGTAVDAKGRAIVLAQERTVGFEAQPSDQTVLLVISYSEEGADVATGGDENTRWHELPRVEVFSEDKTPTPDTHIRLARLVISERGTVSSEPDTSVRRGAGPRWVGEAEVHRLTLAREGVDPSKWPALSCGAPGRVDLTDVLTVNGSLGIGTTEPKNPLSVSGGVAIGSGYADRRAPDNGLLVEGNVGIGTAEPKSPLSVSGSAAIGVDYVAKTAPLDGLIVQGNVGIGTSDPKIKLEVIGDIGLGSKETRLYAPGGVENLNLIRGTVAPDGSTLAGQGFRVKKLPTVEKKPETKGGYDITFDPAFSAKPTVVATQQFPNDDKFGDRVDQRTTDNCVVAGVSESQCRIICGDGDGKPEDRRFHFIAIGPR